MKKIFLSTAILALAATVCTRELAAGNPPKPTVLGQELIRFGNRGIGPSQINDLDHIAVDPQGFLYVSDYKLSRLQRFSREGKLDSLFYFEPGAFVRSLAFDHGFLYVVLESQLLRYDPSSWTLVGKMEPPLGGLFLGVAPRPAGGVVALVAGETDDVLFIRGDGTVERTLKGPLKGRSNFRLANPVVLAVDSGDHVYIGDNHVYAIFRLDPLGRFLSRFSSEGEGPGQVHHRVEGMAIDSLDRLWVSDWGGTNVFASDGRFLFRLDNVDGESYAITDRDELCAALDTAVVCYAAWDLPLPAGKHGEPEKPALPERSMAGEPVEPAGLVAVDPQGFLYTADPKTGRILRFNAQTQLDEPFELRSPGQPWTGLAVDRGGTLYIAAEDRLFRYDRTGRLLGEVRHPDGEGFFHVASRPDAGVLASWRNAGRDDLVLVGKDGTIETIHRNAVSGAAGEPAGDVLVAVDGRRNLYAASRRLHAVFLFKHNGEYVNRFGSEGGEPGQLSGSITGLAADGQGRIFVSDARRINVFLTQDGRFLRRREGGGSGLAISDGDDVFAVNGTRIVRFPAGKPEEE